LRRAQQPSGATSSTKEQLATAVNRILKARELKQSEAALLLGVPQPKISQLTNYRLTGFSAERLIALLTSLKQDVHISIRPSANSVGRISVVSES
jgi:predicted XRE-type DNA-binding protein